MYHVVAKMDVVLSESGEYLIRLNYFTESNYRVYCVSCGRQTACGIISEWGVLDTVKIFH